MIRLILLIVSGIISGVLDKYLNVLPYELPGGFWGGELQNFLTGLAGLGNAIFLWVFIGSLIAAFSLSPRHAGLNTSAYLFSMTVGYYIFSNLWYHINYIRWFILWSVISVISFFIGYIFWHARGRGRIAVILVSLPTGMMLTSFFLAVKTMASQNGWYWSRRHWIGSIPTLIFSLVAFVILLLLLQRGLKQRLYALLFSAGFAAIALLGLSAAPDWLRVLLNV